ncbi:MAG: VOC family protein [Coriobacteriia bacterium]|nr:VOC family protein [Coriobacteriia bacterium]MCL2750991.1 VOC family protein [Coriobacteriia bacterium]
MQLELYFYFDGNCREALEFYARVFNSSVNNLMTYGDAPPNPEHPVSEEDQSRVLYAGIPIGNMVAMFSDVPYGTKYTLGTNISPTIGTEDKQELARLFNELKEGGEVQMELQETFFSECFGMVVDKFGLMWQLTHYVPDNQ